MTIMLICPSGAVAQVLDRLGLSEADDGPAVTVVTWGPADVGPGSTRAILTLGPPSPTTPAFVRTLSRSVVGRNLLRLTPLDGGRRLARVAVRENRFRQAAAEADLIVAVERDGILAAWKAGRRWARPNADVVYGVAAADALLRRSRSA